MTKIRCSSDQLKAFDEGFHERVGFHPPTPKVPSGKTVLNYLASLSDEHFMTLGRAVYAETKLYCLLLSRMRRLFINLFSGRFFSLCHGAGG